MFIIKCVQKCVHDVLSNKLQLLAACVAVTLVLSCFSHVGELLSRAAEHAHARPEPIDVVYTWVNGSDPLFRQRLQEYLMSRRHHVQDFSDERFDDKYELKFSLRSLERFAPWVRHVYIVTNGQIPYWLNIDYDRVTLVSHEEIFLDLNDLPTFSSPAIESNIHRIKGLSERFVYLNDDVLLGAATHLEDFVSPNRGQLVYLAWPLPPCVPDCPWAYVGDGQCDTSCYHPHCQYDGGDCERRPVTRLAGDYVHIGEEEEDEDEEPDYQAAAPNVAPQAVPQGAPHTVPRDNVSLSEYILRSDPHHDKNISFIVDQHNRKTLLDDKLRRQKRTRRLRKYNQKGGPNGTRNGYRVAAADRQPLDAYALSLQHTNRVFNNHYGYKARKVPAHSPIFIDKRIMNELQHKFPEEFERTARNRLRSANDMQYAFSYYYHLVDERIRRSNAEIFDLFDTDGSGTWSDRELRTLLTRINELPLSFEMVERVDNAIINCSKYFPQPHIVVPPYERYIDSKLPTVSKELVLNCKFICEILQHNFGSAPKYQYEIIKSSQSQHVMFKMLTSNVSQVVAHLDEIRKFPRKFVCINDNMNPKKHEENDLVRAILLDFYLSLFPKPSKFELPPEYRNRFAYLHELNEWKLYHSRTKLVLLICIVFLCFFCFYNTCRRKLLRRLKNIIYFH